MRKIIHIDMDAFYAAVEQRDNPELCGKAIIVGGNPESRGVVATASYEARRFGVRSAMSSAHAKRLCPHAIFLPPRMSAYREASAIIMGLCYEYTDKVEPLSLDEAYLDVTLNRINQPSATLLAQELRRRILLETGLTASAGVAPNKFLAKVASDMQKPNGLTVIPPERVDEILARLPVGKVPGIGKKTEARLQAMGVMTTGDLRAQSEEVLRQNFGKVGRWFFNLSRGIDERPVVSEREIKSVSLEDTYEFDIVDTSLLADELLTISKKLFARLERKEVLGRTLTLKVTYADFSKITRSKTIGAWFGNAEQIYEIALTLLSATEAGTRPIRLLGLGVSNLNNGLPIAESPRAGTKDPRQLEFPFFRAKILKI